MDFACGKGGVVWLGTAGISVVHKITAGRCVHCEARFKGVVIAAGLARSG